MNDKKGLGLEPGWDWVGRKVDLSDKEYSVLAPVLLALLPFVALHMFINQLLSKKFPQFVRKFTTLLSLAWLYSVVGLRLSLIIFLQPLIMFNLLQFGSSIFVWAFFLSSIFVYHSPYSLCTSCSTIRVSRVNNFICRL